tara:strand:+ start:6788 stop:6964 length:177 start_codon:yes stop_codon:yes gene_type:complete
MPTLTSAQVAFLNDLRLANTDARATAVIEAAFVARNGMPLFVSDDDLALLEACDKAAG